MQNDVQSLNSKDIDLEESDFSTRKIYYYTDKNQSYYKIDEYADVIYNGKAYPAYDVDTFRINQGDLTFVDNDDDGYYEVVFVDEYYNIYVSGVDIDNGTIFGKYGNSIEIEDCENLSFYTSDGAVSNIKNINAKNVISVYQSMDTSLTKIVVSSQGVSGKVDEIRDIAIKPSNMTPIEIEQFKKKMREMRVVVNKEELSFSESYIEAVLANYQGAGIPNYGMAYSFYLDKNRNISGVEDTATDRYAYLTKVAYIEDSSEMYGNDNGKIIYAGFHYYNHSFFEKCKDKRGKI